MASLDKFDEFLLTFHNKNLEDLVNAAVASSGPFGNSTAAAAASHGAASHGAASHCPGNKRPLEPIDLPRQEKLRVEAAGSSPPLFSTAVSSTGAETTVPSPVEVPSANASLETRVKELERKQHNRSRGGRNRLYYEVKLKFGEAAAKPFYVPEELKATEVTAPPPPAFACNSRAETLPPQVPPPPPPPPSRVSASSSSSSDTPKAPSRDPMNIHAPPQWKQYSPQ